MALIRRLAQLAVLAFFIVEMPLSIMASSGSGPLAQTGHSTITIDGDAQLTSANGVVAGDGSSANPYIIENWSINASMANGISILNTTKHIVIRNCYLYRGNDSNRYGVYLDTVSNVTLWNNTYKNDYNGINIFNSTKLTVRDSLVTGSGSHGVYIDTSSHVWIDNLTSKGNPGGHGMMIKDSGHITVANSSFSKNRWGGINEYTTDNDTFINNTIFDNPNYGFDMVESTDAKVVGNTIINSSEGVYSIWAQRNLFKDNIVTDNKDVGMTLRDMGTSRVINNEISGSGSGISLESVYKTLLSGNKVHDNGDGISLHDSWSNTFYSNEMDRNDHNFGMWRYSGLDTVPMNNTINGKPIYYWYNQSDKTVPADAAYVALINCRNITVKGHDLSHNRQGIIIVSSSNITVQDNDFIDNYDGILVDASHGNITGNRIVTSLTAIDIRNSDNNVIRRNYISNTSEGIFYWGGRDIVIEDNVIDNITNRSHYAYYGIRLDELDTATVRNNTIRDGVGRALFTWGVHDLIIEDNFLRNFTSDGMWVRGSQSKIRNNTVLECGNGIRLQGSYSDVFDNVLVDNVDHGLISDSQVSSRRSNNYIAGSKTGIFIGSTAVWSVYDGNRIVGNLNGVTFDGFVNGGLFYNNYFNNSVNYGGDTDFNTWNISKTLKENIIEGPYLGGNYWSDYNGTDLDEDLLGDTGLPWGPGDLRPLMFHPAIIDRTNGTPFTNGSFTFDVEAYFKAGIKNVTVDCWFDNGSGGHSKAVLDLALGNHYEGRFSGAVDVPPEARVLYYFITANSDEGGSASTNIRNLTVVDTMGPSVKDLSGTPMTGKNLTLELEARDNWDITGMQVSYWFDTGNLTNISGLNMTLNISVPETAHLLHFTVNVTDAAGHWAAIKVDKVVLDVIAPSVLDATGEPRNGKTMYFFCNATDNWFVAGVRLTYDFGGRSASKNMTLGTVGYFIDVDVPQNATVMNFVARAADSAGNSGEMNGSFQVADTIGPVIVDMQGTPTTGDYYDIQANMTDRIAGPVKNGIIDYWFDSSTPVRVNFNGFFRVLVPTYAHVLSYAIWCSDPSGNSGHMNRTLAVVDNDSPTMTDSSGTSPEVKKEFNFSVEAQDNWNVRTVQVEYWFEGQRTTLNLTPWGKSYNGKIGVPAGSRKLHYIIHVEDTSGNKAASPERTLDVKTPVQPPNRLTEQLAWMLLFFLLLLIIAILIIVYYVIGRSRKRPKVRRTDKRVGKDDSEE